MNFITIKVIFFIDVCNIIVCQNVIVKNGQGISISEDNCCNVSTVGESNFKIIQEGEKVKLTFCSNLCKTYYSSCLETLRANPYAASGYYKVKKDDDTLQQVYCNMCALGEGWTRIAFLNMSDPSEQCPSGFELYQV